MTQKQKEDAVLDLARSITESRAKEVVAEAAVQATTADGDEVTVYIADEIEKGEDGRYPAGTSVYSEEPADNPEAPLADDGPYTIDGEEYNVVDGAIAEQSDDSDGEDVETQGIDLEAIRALLTEAIDPLKAEINTLKEGFTKAKTENAELVAENAALEAKVDEKAKVVAESAAIDGVEIQKPQAKTHNGINLSKFMKQN